MAEARQLEVGRRTGLTEAEARTLLAAAGDRTPAPAGRSYKSIVLSNTLTLFNLILLVFFIVVLAAGRPADGLFAFIMVANSGLGITQEIRAKRTLESAALLVAPRARVIRDGKEREVTVEQVVDGDLISVRSGDQIVADGTVVESSGLMLDESPLTGESVAVERGVGDQVLSGSFAVEGGGQFVAEHTGAESYAAKVSGTAREHRAQRSPLELQINQLLKVLVGVMIPLGAAFVYVLIRHHLPFRDAAGVATAGIVTLVPEGLILLTSMTFAAAAIRLTHHGLLVQYLNSVESLANVDTVCLDKTGTLTDGALALHAVMAVPGEEEPEVRTLLGGFANSVSARNATVEAIAAAEPQAAAWGPAGQVPFSSRWKWSAARRSDADDWLVLGAPDVLGIPLGAASSDEAAGRRVLAFGWTDAVPDPTADATPPRVTPLALVVFEERLRSDAVETVEFLKARGIALKVFSGDSPVTVAAVAARAGIAEGAAATEGSALPTDARELGEVVAAGSVFGRLTPQNKRDMVEALTARGAYVAMVGDGVNDVPAMKASRLAIALGSGSQLAKSVADGVLVTDRFGAIPRAIGEGRQIIRNVQRVAKLFVTKSVFAAFVILTFGLTTADFPLLPRHLSLAGIFTVGIPGFALALSRDTAPPDTEPFLRSVARFAIPAGIVTGAATIVAYLAVEPVKGYTAAQGRTAAVLAFVAVGLYVLLVLDADRMRADRRHTAFVLGLTTALAAGFLVTWSWPPARDFFALSQPSVWIGLVVIADFVASVWLLAKLGLSPYASERKKPPAALPQAASRTDSGT